jgi:hypothetical protein
MTTSGEFARRTHHFFERSRFLRDNLTVPPDVNRRAVGARNLSGGFRGATQSATYGHRKCL